MLRRVTDGHSPFKWRQKSSSVSMQQHEASSGDNSPALLSTTNALYKCLLLFIIITDIIIIIVHFYSTISYALEHVSVNIAKEKQKNIYVKSISNMHIGDIHVCM